MTDREKAIRILEGNYKSFVLRHNGELLTVNELIALLKAQKPRVMTLEEVRNNEEEAAWFESRGTFRGKKGFWILLGKTNAGSFTKKIMCATGMTDTELGLSAYGETWRCWTALPTEEQRRAIDAQREAAKWDD